MTQEIIEMAKQAGASPDGKLWLMYAEELEAFAKLVAAKAKAKAKERDACANIYAQLFTDPENQPTQYGTVTVEFMNREIAKEREWLIEYIQEHQPSCKQMIKAIDARGQA